MKWFRRLLLLSGLFLLSGVGGLWWWVGRSGATSVEAWVRDYIIAVLDKHLTPRIQLERLDYQFPRTVVINGLSLASDGTSILTVRTVTIELAEIPCQGQPILIEGIELDQATACLRRSTEGLIGWTGIVEPLARARPDSVEPGFRLSDCLRIRRASIRNGAVSFQPLEGPAMELDAIAATMDGGSPSEAPGEYGLRASMAREGLFDASLLGALSIDSGAFRMDRLEALIDLRNDRYAIFPPALQTWLKRFGPEGRCDAVVSASFAPGRSPIVSGAATLADIQILHGGRRESISTARVHIEAAGGDVRVTGDGQALQGTFSATAVRPEDAELPIELRLACDGIDIERLVRLLPAETRDRLKSFELAGCASGELRAEARRDAWESFEGEARLSLTQFQLSTAGRRVDGADLSIDGQVDAAELTADVRGEVDGARLAGKVKLARSDHEAMRFDASLAGLPAASLQSWLIPSGGSSALMLSGQCDLTMRGSVPLTAPLQLACSGRVSSQDFILAAENRIVRTSPLHVEFDWGDPQLKYRIEAGTLGGRISAAGEWTRAAPGVVPIELRFADLELSAVERLLNKFDATKVSAEPAVLSGRAIGDFRGVLDPSSPIGATGRATVDARQVEWRMGGTLLRLGRVQAQLDSTEGRMNAEASTGLLGGDASIRGQLVMSGNRPARISWRIKDADLRRLPELLGSSAAPRRGLVSSNGSAAASMNEWPASITGDGSVQLRDAEFMHLPILSDVVGIVGGRLIPSVAEPSDTAESNFQLAGDRLTLSGLRASSLLFDLHGGGVIRYDGSLDIAVRGGPLRKVESLLGPVGAAIGRVTDKAVEYRIGGSLGSPRVGVHPLGLGER